ncbi:MAG: T9SS type A sorting domain-containing protein [Bacteroidaceae bacterium]|nr:T9SS type A sorting domain-containing protein [Bacteroidaceae bacterium]
MKKIYLCLSFLILPIVSLAQSKIGYAYDMAGNRTKREIVISSLGAMAKKQYSNSLDVSSEKLREHFVKINPNPTQGNLKVGISGLKNSDKCYLELYSVQGVQILAFDVNSDNTDVDISNQPNGIYLLKITINGKSTTWKIIKK